MVEDYNVYEPEKKERFFMTVGFALAMAFAGYIFYGTFLFALCLPFVYRKSVSVYCKYQAEKRKKALLREFRDLLFSLSSSFAAGRHMEEAMEEAEVNLSEIYGEESLMRRELAYMLRRMRQAGETDLKVWEDFSVRCGLEDAQDFTQVFSACRDTGGDLVRAVNKAAAVIGDKISIEMEIRAMISQKKLEGRIITAMPAGIVLFLQAVSPDYLNLMYQTGAGRLLMTAALSGIVFAYIWIERITAIEV